LRRAEGGGNFFGVFRVKNHDFTPKNHVLSVAEGGAKIFEVFRVKNHDLPPKDHIFFQF
jgi:DNA-directed RNA polymerase subunit H (RpoH/RPB5)